MHKAVKEVATTRSSSTFDELKSKCLPLYCTALHLAQTLIPSKSLHADWKIFHQPNKVLQLDNVIATRVHAKERSRTEEAYNLAKVTGPVTQLKEGGTYEGSLDTCCMCNALS